MGNRHTASHSNTKLLPEDIQQYRKSISEVVVKSCAAADWHVMLALILEVKTITKLSILDSFVPEDCFTLKMKL